MFALPLPGGRFRMVYEHAVEPPRADDPDAIREFTQRCTDVLEMYVRRYPELWLWMHRRWRDVPPDDQRRRMFPRHRVKNANTDDRTTRSERGGVLTCRARIRAPNWLGDAVMALPAMARGARRVRRTRTLRSRRVPSVAPLFEERTSAAPDAIVAHRIARAEMRRSSRAAGVRRRLLLPNSFRIRVDRVPRAGIAERWGYAAGGRGCC